MESPAESQENTRKGLPSTGENHSPPPGIVRDPKTGKFASGNNPSRSDSLIDVGNMLKREIRRQLTPERAMAIVERWISDTEKGYREARKLLLAYLLGTPVQSIDLQGGGDVSITLNYVQVDGSAPAGPRIITGAPQSPDVLPANQSEMVTVPAAGAGALIGRLLAGSGGPDGGGADDGMDDE